MTDYIVFTDLDGTLLDHHTYQADPAFRALSRLKETSTPLIMVSSKTRSEMEVIRRSLKNDHPFIPENGGAIYIPDDYRLPVPDDSLLVPGYRLLVLGRPREDVTRAFDRLASEFPVRALSRLSGAEITRLTGLTGEQAENALKREFGEAFLMDDPHVRETDLENFIESIGFRMTKGGRFYHLIGENDKGRAVSILADLYRAKAPDIVTVAVGDARNDAPMLAAVDKAFLVAGPGGGHRDVNVAGLLKVPAIGPEGFNQVIMDLLGSPGS
jgi:mannosyl-3-phosphoglycerate phosphatase